MLVKTIDDNITFLFTHPESYIIISGRVSDISTEGIRFYPKMPQRTTNLEIGMRLPGCSLKLGDTIYSVDCSVIQNNQFIGLKFDYFEKTGGSENPELRTFLLEGRTQWKIRHRIEEQKETELV